MKDGVPMGVVNRFADCAEHLSRSCRVQLLVAQNWVSGRPSTYSMTNQGVPSGKLSAS